MAYGMSAKDFMNTMENLITNPNQKLIGDANGGYVYVDTEKPELMYAVKEIHKAKREAAIAKAQCEALRYTLNDVRATAEAYEHMKLVIENVIFNDPATIVFWADGTKTIVKALNEDYDPEKGLAMAITKKALGNKGSYYNQIQKWLKAYEDEN